jgi:hypothetical protein
MLRFIDGFDHYNSVQILRKWTDVFQPSYVSVAAGQGRQGGQAGKIQPGYGGFRLTLDNQPTWVIGFAYRNQQTTAGNAQVFALNDGGADQLKLNIHGDGTLTLDRGGTTLCTTPFGLQSTVWYYIELKSRLAPAPSGSYELRVNGAAIGAGSAMNTSNTGGFSGNGFDFGSPTVFTGGESYVDDIYIADSQSGRVTDFLGDVTVETLLPEGNGGSNQWDPSAGSNYACVDETPANDDTNYVSTTLSGRKDLYNYPDLVNPSGTVWGVQALLCVKNPDGVALDVQHDYLSIDGEAAGASYSVPVNYYYARELTEKNPITDAAWTIALVNGMQFGIKAV